MVHHFFILGFYCFDVWKISHLQAIVRVDLNLNGHCYHFYCFNSHHQLRHTLDRGDEQQLKRVLKSASSLATDLSLNIYWNTRRGILERERERETTQSSFLVRIFELFFCIGVWSTTFVVDIFFSAITCLLNNHHHHQSRVREESAGCFVVWLRSSSLFFFVFVVGIKVV